MSAQSREIITPTGGGIEQDLSELADVDLSKLNFLYAKDANLTPAEGNFGFGDFESHKDENNNLEGKIAVAEEFKAIPPMFDSIAVADEIRDDVTAKNSLIMANKFSRSSNGNMGSRLDNSVVVGDYSNIQQFQDREFVDYGPFMRYAENSTWIGDVITSPIFDQSTDNILHGNVGKEDFPVNHMFLDSDRNVVIGDEIYAETIGDRGVNLVVADDIEADNISSNTMVLEGNDFRGSKVELANYFFKISNKRLSPFKAFNLNGTFEDWREINEEVNFANEVWKEVNESYRQLQAAQNVLDLPELEGSNEEIYDRLKQFQTNFQDINRGRVQERNVIAAADFLDNKGTILFGDGENSFRFSYDEGAGNFERVLSAIGDDIEEELTFFDFDGGESPEDLLREIEELEERSEAVRSEYEDPLALFENLGLNNFESTEDIEERLSRFDQEIKYAAVSEFGITQKTAENLVESEQTSYIVDILPNRLEDHGKENYLQVLTGSLNVAEEVDIRPEEVERVQEDVHGLFNSPIDAGYQAQILDKLINDVQDEDDASPEAINDFSQAITNLDESTRQELFELLKTDKDKMVEVGEDLHGHSASYTSGDHKFGKTLFDIATSRDYRHFIDSEDKMIQNLLDTEAELPESDSITYNVHQEEIDELIEEKSDRVKRVTCLARQLGIDYNPVDSLKNSSKDDWEKELEKDLNDKLRAYMKQNLEELGFKAALDQYEGSTGERPDELSDYEVNALIVRDRQGSRRGIRNTVDKLLENQDQIYEHGDNKEWLDEKDWLDKETVIDPDLSEYADAMYDQPDNAERNSELRVEIDSDKVEFNTGRMKEQQLEEIRELAERLDIDQKLKDIEEAESVVANMDDPKSQEDYKELKDALEQYEAIENMSSGIPDELRMQVATPMETTAMGEFSNSCHHVESGSKAWASISNAVDANKMVFRAVDSDGNQRARAKAFITEEQELIYHNTSQYKDIEIDTSEYFEGYMDKVASELDLELKHSSEAEGWKQRTELLEAHDWYSNH